MTKLENLAQLIKIQTLKKDRDSAIRTYERDNCPEVIEKWDKNIGSKYEVIIIPGRKYTKINTLFPNECGKYMVVNTTGEIYGIKGYGTIHKGHYYGTLDTIDNYYWGGFTASPLKLEDK